jgi:hypothetical protein
MATQPKIQMELGLERASSAHRTSLEAAKLLAEFIGGKQDTVSADDVFKWFDPSALGASAGAIFRNGPWTFSHWATSERESNHCRPLRAWRLIRNGNGS